MTVEAIIVLLEQEIIKAKIDYEQAQTDAYRSYCHKNMQDPDVSISFRAGWHEALLDFRNKMARLTKAES